MPKVTTKKAIRPRFTPAGWEHAAALDRVLCIGLDLAWFGGGALNAQSQSDLFSMVTLDLKSKTYSDYCYVRVPLSEHRVKDDPHANCDPDAHATIQHLQNAIAERNIPAVLLAIDAPLVARPHERIEFLSKREKKGVQQRVCEAVLREGIRGTSQRWKPQIQPGRPLCKRLVRLRDHLIACGFSIFPNQSEKMLMECFPSEAIWSGFQLTIETQWKSFKDYGNMPLDSVDARAYKNAKGQTRLPLAEYAKLVIQALSVIAHTNGLGARLWNQLIVDVIKQLAADGDFLYDGSEFGRSGKKLDDVVDSVLSLATSTAFAVGTAHVWMDADHEDGHILGPGNQR